MLKPWIALAGASLLVSACANDPHTTNTTLAGGALGAAAGAIIGNNVGSGSAASGALIGGALGAGAGAYKGCRDQGGCGGAQASRQQYYDERAGRYYYHDPATGRYYWEDGSPRY
jgi:uncharacterized protein YcfJ